MDESKTIHDLLETCRRLGIGSRDLEAIEAEGLITVETVQGKRVLDDGQLERLEIIGRLSRDLAVNLPGIDVILEMRGRMIQMRQEVDQILDFLRRQISEDLRELLGEENYPMALGPGEEFLAVSRGTKREEK
ncbi:MAG: hypothetical protein JSV26_12010 [bacterium]|nr:MAG: hypothetical protein JSV26_12010 [bacterium]